MRKSLYTLLALIMINSSTGVKPTSHLMVDYGQHVVVTHPGIGPCEWSYDGQDFYVIHEGQSYQVDPLCLDKDLIGISKKNLLRFLSCGYLYINRLDNGEFTIKAKGRLNGGFPIILAVIGAGVISGIISGVRGSGTPTYSEPVNNFQAVQARIEADIVKTDADLQKTEAVQIPIEVVAKNSIIKEAIDIKGAATIVDIKLEYSTDCHAQLSPNLIRTEPLPTSISIEKTPLILHQEVEQDCLMGPGIPRLIPLPGTTRLPMMKMVRPVEPVPILPGERFFA